MEPSLTLGPPNLEQALEAEHTPVKHRSECGSLQAEAEEKNQFLETLSTGTSIHLPTFRLYGESEVKEVDCSHHDRQRSNSGSRTAELCFTVFAWHLTMKLYDK